MAESLFPGLFPGLVVDVTESNPESAIHAIDRRYSICEQCVIESFALM
jgi:hypothetical protein